MTIKQKRSLSKMFLWALNKNLEENMELETNLQEVQECAEWAYQEYIEQENIEVQ